MRRLVLGVVVAAVGFAFIADPHGGVPRSVNEGVERVTRTIDGQGGWTGDLVEHSDGWVASHTNPDGRPARWDPCTPITFKVNAAAGGDGALDDALAAVDQVSAATGLQFAYLGETDHIPTVADAADAVAASGAMVVIAWAAPAQSDLYEFSAEHSGESHAAHADGIGGPDVIDDGGFHRYVSGSVLLNPDANSRRAAGFSGGSRGALLLHEIGHLVGLGHTDDRTQIMAANANSAPRFGAGDLAGLASVGGRC